MSGSSRCQDFGCYIWVLVILHLYIKYNMFASLGNKRFTGATLPSQLQQSLALVFHTFFVVFPLV